METQGREEGLVARLPSSGVRALSMSGSPWWGLLWQLLSGRPAGPAPLGALQLPAHRPPEPFFSRGGAGRPCQRPREA